MGMTFRGVQETGMASGLFPIMHQHGGAFVGHDECETTLRIHRNLNKDVNSRMWINVGWALSETISFFITYGRRLAFFNPGKEVLRGGRMEEGGDLGKGV